MRSSINIEKLLIAEGADIHTRNRDGDTPLDLAKCFKAGAEIIKLLEIHGAKE